MLDEFTQARDDQRQHVVGSQDWASRLSYQDGKFCQLERERASVKLCVGPCCVLLLHSKFPRSSSSNFVPTKLTVCRDLLMEALKVLCLAYKTVVAPSAPSAYYSLTQHLRKRGTLL